MPCGGVFVGIVLGFLFKSDEAPLSSECSRCLASVREAIPPIGFRDIRLMSGGEEPIRSRIEADVFPEGRAAGTSGALCTRGAMESTTPGPRLACF